MITAIGQLTNLQETALATLTYVGGMLTGILIMWASHKEDVKWPPNL